MTSINDKWTKVRLAGAILLGIGTLILGSGPINPIGMRISFLLGGLLLVVGVAVYVAALLGARRRKD